MIHKSFNIKKTLLVLACALLFFSSFVSVFTNASAAEGSVYKIYYPIHEISLLDKNDSLSVASQTLNLDLNTKIDGIHNSHRLSTEYSIYNSGAPVNTRIAVPFQDTISRVTLNDFSLTVNGNTVAPAKIYFDKTTSFAKSYYHPAFRENGYKFDPLDVLSNAFCAEEIVFDSSLCGTRYEFAPIDTAEDMVIEYTLHDSQKIYHEGFSIGSTGKLTVKEEDYIKNDKYTVFVTSDELDYELTNASVVSATVLSYNDFIPLIKESVWFEKSAKNYPDFIVEQFDNYIASYLRYFLTDLNDKTFISTSVLNWTSGYRFMFLVYDIQFLSGTTELVLERPIEKISFTNDYYGFDINNAPAKNWADFGNTTINVTTSAEYTYAEGYPFRLTKNDNSSYTFSGNLTDKEVYQVFYRKEKPAATTSDIGDIFKPPIKAWEIVLFVIWIISILVLFISLPFTIREIIRWRREKK